MVNGDTEEKMNKWASVGRALSVYQDLTPASKVWRRQAMAKRWSIFSWKCRIRDPPGRRTQDLCYHWKWSKSFRWESGLSIPSAARGEMGHSRAEKHWKAESTGKSWTTSMKRQETAGATLQRTHKMHHEKNQQSASSVHASHNQCISSQFPASQRPSAPFNTGSGMNKEIPLSISPVRWERSQTFSAQGAGRALQKGDAVLQFPPRVGVAGIVVTSAGQAPAWAMGPEASPSAIVFA